MSLVPVVSTTMFVTAWLRTTSGLMCWSAAAAMASDQRSDVLRSPNAVLRSPTPRRCCG